MKLEIGCTYPFFGQATVIPKGGTELASCPKREIVSFWGGNIASWGNNKCLDINWVNNKHLSDYYI